VDGRTDVPTDGRTDISPSNVITVGRFGAVDLIKIDHKFQKTKFCLKLHVRTYLCQHIPRNPESIHQKTKLFSPTGFDLSGTVMLYQRMVSSAHLC